MNDLKKDELPKYNELIKALKSLNKENINLMNSREYKIGRGISKTIKYLCKFQISNLIKDFKNKFMYKVVNKNDISKKTIYNISKKILDFCPRIAIYTCIIGKYDNIQEPLFVPENCDFYIITDKVISNESKFKKINPDEFFIKNNYNNIEKNRYFKMHPHLIFPEYDFSIYIDGNIRVIADLTEFIKCISPIGIAMHSHSKRDCLYNEAKVCMKLKKGKKDDIINQIQEYSLEGMPHRYGLFEANMIVREHNNPICIKLMEEWWNQFLIFSKRDQISFPYVLWKNGIKYDSMGILGNNIYKNYSIRIVNHSKQ